MTSSDPVTSERRLDEHGAVLVRQRAAPGEEHVRGVEVEQVGDAGRVEVAEVEQPPGEVARVVVRAEQAAELLVEDGLGGRPGKPGGVCCRWCG